MKLAESDESIKSVIEIGSQTRTHEKADEYSDLDVVIISNAENKFLKDDKILSEIGDIRISFSEPTFGGGMERRILFDGNFDVDFILLTPQQFESLMDSRFVDGIFARGYSIIYDTINAAEKFNCINANASVYSKMSDDEYNNLVNDFWFHTVWAAKRYVAVKYGLLKCVLTDI